MSISGSRLRYYDSLDKFPKIDNLLEIANKCIKRSHELDNSLIESAPTHAIFLQYPKESEMLHHKDVSKNDGDGLYPVVAVSVGNSCDFGIKWRENGKYIERTMLIESGDVIIFGGDSRHILHSVKKVHLNTSPFSQDIGRINCSFRYSPSMYGKEEEFRKFTTDDYVRQFKKQ